MISRARSAVTRFSLKVTSARLFPTSARSVAWIRTAAAAEQQHKLEAWDTSSGAELAGPLQPAQMDDLLAQQRALAAKAGVPEDILLDSAMRSLRQENDETWLRPDPGGLGSEIAAAFDRVDMLDLYALVHCPLLIFIATKSLARPAPRYPAINNAA